MNRYQYITVKYHSYEWAILVETGWFTREVDDQGNALMMRKV